VGGRLPRSHADEGVEHEAVRPQLSHLAVAADGAGQEVSAGREREQRAGGTTSVMGWYG
jgi:hypothetical protein